MKKEILDDLLDKYALNKLSNAEQKQLEKFISENPDFKKELIIRKDIAKSMEYLGKEDLKKILNKIHHEEFEQTKKPNHLKWIIPLLLLGLVALILFLSQGKNLDNDTNTSELYASHYEPFIASSQTRGDDIEQILNSFYSSYDAKDYQKALNTIKPVLVDQKNEILLLAAISGMETDDFVLSHKLFDQILESKDYYFSDHANWYKSLCLIKENKKEESKKILKVLISDPNADHYQEATSLLKELE